MQPTASLRQRRRDFTADGIMNNASPEFLPSASSSPLVEPHDLLLRGMDECGKRLLPELLHDAQALATYGVDKGSDLEAKVDNWHNKILNSNIPDWLKDLAINCMHVFNCMTDWTAPNTYGMVESMSDGLYAPTTRRSIPTFLWRFSLRMPHGRRSPA